MEKKTGYLQSYRQTPDIGHIDTLDGIRVLIILIVGWFHIWQQGWYSPSFTIGGEYISLDFLLPAGGAEALNTRLLELSGGAVEALVLGEEFRGVPLATGTDLD